MGVTGIQAAASAFGAAQVRFANTAHNVANLSTPGARRLETVQAARQGGGVEASTRVGTRGIDLAEEAIELRSAKTQADVAARTIRSIAETDRSVIDLLA